MESISVAKGTIKITSVEIIKYLALALFYVVITKTGALTETDLGVLSILTFLGSTIPVLTSLSLPIALTKYVSESLKINDEAKAAIVRKTVNVTVTALSIMGLVITFLLSEPISQYFWKSKTYAPLIILMGFYAFFLGLDRLFSSSLQAFFLFGARSIVAIVSVVSSTILGVSLALLNFGVYGVMFGYIAGYSAASFASFMFGRRKVSSPNSYMSLRPLLKFSLPLFLGQIVLLGLDWADIAVLASISSDYTVLGIYYLAARSVTFLSVLYLPIAYTVLPLLSAHHGIKDFQGIGNALKTVSRYIHYLMLPACIGVAMIASTALKVFYGHQYAYGSVSLAILSVTQILVALYYVFTTTLTAIGKTSDILKINIISVFCYIGLLLVLVPVFAGVGAASARFAMQAIGLAITVYLLSKNMKVVVDKKSLWKSIIASISIMPILVLTEHILASFSVYLILAVDIVAGVSVYLLLLYILRALDHQDFELLKRTFPSLIRYLDVIEKIMVRKT
jgi:stage V sporulation protein B